MRHRAEGPRRLAGLPRDGPPDREAPRALPLLHAERGDGRDVDDVRPGLGLQRHLRPRGLFFRPLEVLLHDVASNPLLQGLLHPAPPVEKEAPPPAGEAERSVAEALSERERRREEKPDQKERDQEYRRARRVQAGHEEGAEDVADVAPCTETAAEETRPAEGEVGERRRGQEDDQKTDASRRPAAGRARPEPPHAGDEEDQRENERREAEELEGAVREGGADSAPPSSAGGPRDRERTRRATGPAGGTRRAPRGEAHPRRGSGFRETRRGASRGPSFRMRRVRWPPRRQALFTRRKIPRRPV